MSSNHPSSDDEQISNSIEAPIWFFQLESRLVRISQWFASTSFIHRFIITTAFGIIGGSTFIGFLNTYAIYLYAYRFGARIPVEGVPYINLAAFLVSLAFFLTAVVCVVISYAFLTLSTYVYLAILFIANGVIGPETGIHKIDPSDKVLGRILILIPLIFPFLVVISLIALSYDFDLVYENLSRPLFGEPPLSSTSLTFNLTTPTIIFFIVIQVLIILIVVTSKWRWLTKWVVLILTVSLIAFVIWSMFFSPNVYTTFLREIKFGGGVPIDIIYESVKDGESTINGHLFLISANNYVVYESTHQRYIEVPISKVTQIHYKLDEVHKTPPSVREFSSLFSLGR